MKGECPGRVFIQAKTDNFFPGEEVASEYYAVGPNDPSFRHNKNVMETNSKGKNNKADMPETATQERFAIWRTDSSFLRVFSRNLEKMTFAILRLLHAFKRSVWQEGGYSFLAVQLSTQGLSALFSSSSTFVRLT